MEMYKIYNTFIDIYRYTDYFIVTIPFLFLVSNINKFKDLTKTALNIIRWIFIIGALLQLLFYINEAIQFFWFGAYEQIAYIPEQIAFYNRAFGEYWYFYWIMLLGNMIFPVFLLIPYFGRSYFWVFVFAFPFKVGIYMERWIIIYSSSRMGGLESNWINEYGITVSVWILQGVIYGIGLLGISYLILNIKKQYSK